MSGPVSILPILQCKLHKEVGLHLHALTRPWASVKRHHPHVFVGFNIVEGEPAPHGRFTLSSYIPNIRPQIGLNLFISIFHT